MQHDKNWHMGKKKQYWIATHSIEPNMFCPTRIHPVLRCSVVMEVEHGNVARVYSANGCTTWVPRNKLFDTAKEAWADYRENRADAEPKRNP